MATNISNSGTNSGNMGPNSRFSGISRWFWIAAITGIVVAGLAFGYRAFWVKAGPTGVEGGSSETETTAPLEPPETE